MTEEIRHIPFELKELSDSGEFVGFASVFGNIDLGNDVVEPGAFEKTIREHGNKVRLMDSHKARIGVALVETTPFGLKATGKINVEKQSGSEAYADLKFYQKHGMPMGMSIGYETIKSTPAARSKDGARHLEQIRLWEVTITEFPMNELAMVTSVKSLQDLIKSAKERRTEGKEDFDSRLEQAQLSAAVGQMESALFKSLADIRRDAKDADPVVESEKIIERFRKSYLSVLPDYLELVPEEFAPEEEKAGRVLSRANRNLVKETVEKLLALLDSAGVDADDKEESPEKSSAPTGAAEASPSEPDDHHSEALSLMIDEIRFIIPKK